MPIDTIKQRVAELQEAIPGIKRGYQQLPRGVINTYDLPAFLNFVRPTTYNTDIYGSNDVELTRELAMWLLVKPASEGEEGEGENLVEPWIDLVAKYFFARPSLENLQFIQGSVITEDSGPKKLVWPGTPSNPIGIYWGVEFRLTIVEIMPRVYVDNE